jgi:hypothetical protein
MTPTEAEIAALRAQLHQCPAELAAEIVDRIRELEGRREDEARSMHIV